MAKMLFSLIFILALFSSSNCLAEPKIFILSSYSPEDLCEKPEFEGVVNVLRENLRRYTLKSFWIDSRRKDPQELADIEKRVVKEIEDFSPDVLITLDDIAFQIALRHFTGKKKPAIIFAGVNKPLEEYNREFNFLKEDNKTPTKNITGVYEKLFVLEEMKFLESWWLKGDYKIAFIYSDDPIANIAMHQIQNELKGTPYLDKIVYYKVSTLSQLRETITLIEHNPKVKAFFAFALSVTQGQERLTINEIVPYIVKNICIPEIYPNYYAVAMGFMGGVVIDFKEMGRQAGNIAVKVVQGTPPTKIPVETAHHFSVVINLKRVKECKLPLPDYILNLAERVFLSGETP